ncbi:MAG TPA: hypothetical protein VJ867_09075 [Gemmatimonadaceae bacterium]|nr:hypothetical protein [Gemmatimonadaceae bacterium]
MRLEMLPLVLGVLLGLVGLGLLFDSWAPDTIVVDQERRRRPRRERNRFGETLVGLGVIAMAAAFLGRDTWRYTTLAVIVGTVLLLFGALKNSGYIRGVFARSDRPAVAQGQRRIR